MTEQRLIDATALKTRVCNIPAHGESEQFYAIMGEIARVIERAETVDAVEVVRCGECKNNGGEISQGDIWCDKMERGMIGNCYCSYGIRKEEHNG